MERHVLDRAAPDDQSRRTAAFLRIARAEQAHPSSRALQRQPKSEQPQPLAQVLRIERGHTV